jgi:hypothetical protein
MKSQKRHVGVSEKQIIRFWDLPSSNGSSTMACPGRPRRHCACLRPRFLEARKIPPAVSKPFVRWLDDTR